MQSNHIFEAFVPAKLKILGRLSEASAPPCQGHVSNTATRRIADLFAKLKNDRNALAITDSNEAETKGHKDSLLEASTDRPHSKVAEKNLSTVSNYRLGSGPTHPKLIFKLDIEANFDLRSLLLCQNVSSTHDTCGLLRSTCLPDASKTGFIRQKLSQWADLQQTWIYPDHPVTAISLKLNGSASAGSGTYLSPCDYWQEPSINDISSICVIKRRRLKWQAALCSALDELLLGPQPVDTDIKKRTCKNDLTGNLMESFYVLGSDSESVGLFHAADKESDEFGMQQPAKTLPMSANFFRMGMNAEEASGNKEENYRNSAEVDVFDAENIFCIVSGAKKSFIDRLIELGASPKEVTDKQDLMRSRAAEQRNKRSNRNISSVGRLQEMSTGKTLFLSGSFALRVVADCLAELVFSTAKSSRLAVDVPTIVSSCPFANGIRTPLHVSLVQCSHNFSDLKGRAEEGVSSSASSTMHIGETDSISRNLKSKVSQPFHRIFLTGAVYPHALACLSELLCALSQTLPTQGDNGVETGGGGSGCSEEGGVVTDTVTGPNSSCSTSDTGDKSTDNHSLTAAGNIKNKADKLKTKSFSLSMLQTFDDAFLHPRTTTRITPDSKIEETSAEDSGSTAPIPSAELSKLPKIPMKFTSSLSVDAVASQPSYAGKGVVGSGPDETTSSSRPLANNVLTSATYGADRASSDDNVILDDGWVVAQRALKVPYFFVRVVSSAKMDAFCYYLPRSSLLMGRGRGKERGDRDSILSTAAHTDECQVRVLEEGDGAAVCEIDSTVQTLDSHPSITRVRWSDSMTQHVWAGNAVSNEDGSIFMRAVRDGSSVDVDDRSSRSSNSSSSSSGGERDSTGQKRKHPFSLPNTTKIRKRELDFFYEVIKSAPSQVMCLGDAQHSKVIKKEKTEFEGTGAVLRALNEYEIYAPETIEERERKRKTM